MPTEAAVLEAVAVVPNIAASLWSQLPSSVRIDDLVSDGNFGVVKAARSFDPDGDVPWMAYACMRARWEMMDGLRRADPLPRDARRRGRFRLVRFDDTLTSEWITDHAAQRAFDMVDAREDVAVVLSRLTQRQRSVVEMIYLRGMTLAEVGACYDVGVSSVSQYHSRTMAYLRKEMRA